MLKVKTVEKKIYDVEGFKVDITQNGKNVRSDASLPHQYQGKRMTKNSLTVSQFKKKFQGQFPGYSIKVYEADETEASGQRKLSNVRDTYLD